jgi:RND superfamily putative drug exporter
MKWSVMAFAVVLTILLIVANQFRHVRLSSTDISTVPTNLTSRQVNDTLQQKFANFSSEPIRILVSEPVDPLSSAGMASLESYVSLIEKLPGVGSVDSLASYEPNTEPYSDLSIGPQAAALRVQYVSGTTTLLTVHQTYAPQSGDAEQLVRQIRNISPPSGFSAETGGVSAELVDLLHSLRIHLPTALSIVFPATFILVFLLTGSVILPIKAILLDVLSLCTALGIIAWVFQYRHVPGFVPLTAIGSVDATSAILIFTVAFGLSADYEFFLLSRVKEEYDATDDTSHSIAYGVQRTAGIITAAALLFVSVIGLFMTSKVTLLQQIGLGLAAAIIIDATFVRLILVAATMNILGKYNWWAPRPLKKLHEKIGSGIE